MKKFCAILVFCLVLTTSAYATWVIYSPGGAGLGGELLTNGDFTNWTADDPDGWNVVGENATNYVTESSGACRLVSDGSTMELQQVILNVTKSYRVTMNITAITGTIAIRWGSGLEQNYNSTGLKSKDISPTQTTFVVKRAASCDATFDDISVKEIL